MSTKAKKSIRKNLVQSICGNSRNISSIYLLQEYRVARNTTAFIYYYVCMYIIILLTFYWKHRSGKNYAVPRAVEAKPIGMTFRYISRMLPVSRRNRQTGSGYFHYFIFLSRYGWSKRNVLPSQKRVLDRQYGNLTKTNMSMA